MIISEKTARQIFANEDPIGRRIQLGGRQNDKPWAEIIGIVGDIHQYGLDSPTTPQAYLLYTQSPFMYPGVLLVRSSVAPRSLTPVINEQIWSLDKNTLIFNPMLMDQLLTDSLAQLRFLTSCRCYRPTHREESRSRNGHNGSAPRRASPTRQQQ